MMCQRFMRIFLRFGAAGLKVVTNGSISFVCFVLFCCEEPPVGQRTELHSEFFERVLRDSLFDISFEFVLKRRNASPLIKPFLELKGWQDKKCVY